MPRLIRFVSSDKMPTEDTLTTYDPEFNLVIINKDLYEALDFVGKYQAMRATSTLVVG